MEYKVYENRIEVEGVKDFELRDTLLCGQCFRFNEQQDGSFFGVAKDKKLNLEKHGETLVFYTSEEDFLSFWKDYFDLDLDYSKVKEKLSEIHPTLSEAVKFAPGIRILKQDSFEALISFIISQNNNIKRISGIVDRLCQLCGKEIEKGMFAFPEISVLAKMSPEDLAPIRAGFRARYIIDAAKKVESGEVSFDRIRDLSYDEAKAELMKITGVGVKVADCVLLYGFHKLQGFPMDVWMKRAMAVLFDSLNPESFGEYAGIAQQYIFHYSRLHPELFEEA